MLPEILLLNPLALYFDDWRRLAPALLPQLSRRDGLLVRLGSIRPVLLDFHPRHRPIDPQILCRG